MKKTIITSLVLGAMLALNGCGGGDDPADTAITGTGYYYDSVVSGVQYKCGSREGTTGSNGEFIFTVGESCTFYLKNLKLRDVDKDLLEDGIIVRETDVRIAQLLQTLDSNSNPNDGITIDELLLDRWLETGITNLPNTDSELELALEVLGANGATIVTAADASIHMLGNIIQDKTFFTVIEGNYEWGIVEINFKNNGELSVAYNDIREQGLYVIREDGVQFATNSKGSFYVTIDDMKKDYFLAHDKEKSNASYRLYTNKADAEAYLATLSQTPASPLVPLIGKTVYEYCTDNIHSEMFQLTFQDDGLLRMQGGVLTEFAPYRFDGPIIYVTENGQEIGHTLLEYTDTYIKFDDGNSETTTFYFVEADALANPSGACVN